MKVHTATLAGDSNNQDRVFVTENAVVVLDGASAFEPVDVDAGTYVDVLGAAIVDQLIQQPDGDITNAVAAAIHHATRSLDLVPGHSPSSTVAVLRSKPGNVDLYVLGDSPIYYGTDDKEYVLADQRMSTVAVREREHYRSRLRAGHGYGPCRRRRETDPLATNWD